MENETKRWQQHVPLPWVIGEIVLAYAQQTDNEKIIAWIDRLPNATFTVPGYKTQTAQTATAQPYVVFQHDASGWIRVTPSWSFRSFLPMHVSNFVHLARHSGHIAEFDADNCACREAYRWMFGMARTFRRIPAL